MKQQKIYIIFIIIFCLMMPSISAALIDNSLNIIKKKASDWGYEKVIETSIARWLYDVQKGKHNLEDGLDTILWGSPGKHKKANEAFKLLQVVDNYLLYNYSKYLHGGLIEFTIIMYKDKNKSYLEGQRLQGEFFVYFGNMTYTTVLGVERTVPYFRTIDINQEPLDWMKE